MTIPALLFQCSWKHLKALDGMLQWRSEKGQDRAMHSRPKGPISFVHLTEAKAPALSSLHCTTMTGACVCVPVSVCVHAYVCEREGVMVETTKYESTSGLGCKLGAAPLPRHHGRGDTFLAFPVWYPPQGKHRGLRLTLTL